MPTLYTSLAEIRAFNPCASGWKDIIFTHPHSTEEEMNTQFPLVDCLKSNPTSDVCWLLGKRKIEIQICVKFAKLCADSVAHLKNTAANADAAAYANAAANAAANATTYAAAANATYAAANAAAYAAAAAATYAAAAAYNTQKIKNKEFLIQAIQAYENGEL